MEQVFSAAERQVFAYFNGLATVYGDPMRVLRAMLAAFDGDPNPTIEQMDSPEPTLWVPAAERMVAAVREVFGMAPFDPATGQGATDADCLAALQAWQGWMAAKKAPAAS
jgi:hypothetical protein